MAKKVTPKKKTKPGAKLKKKTMPAKTSKTRSSKPKVGATASRRAAHVKPAAKTSAAKPPAAAAAPKIAPPSRPSAAARIGVRHTVPLAPRPGLDRTTGPAPTSRAPSLVSRVLRETPRAE